MELLPQRGEMTNTFESLSIAQKVRAGLHRDVRAICTESCHFLGLEVTKPAMEIIAELVLKKLLVYGADLEAFSKHAKRTTINSEDVKLLVRRNPSLKTHLNSIVATNLVAAKDKRRKTTVPVAKQPEAVVTKTATPPPSKHKETNSTNEADNIDIEERPPEESLVDNNMVVDDDVMIDLT